MSDNKPSYYDGDPDTQAYFAEYNFPPAYTDNPTYGSPYLPSVSGDSTGSKDSGHESDHVSRGSTQGRPYSRPTCLIDPYIRHSVRFPAIDRPAKWKERLKTDRSGLLCCLYAGCEYQTKGQYDLDRHQKTHLPTELGDKFVCRARGCDRTGEYGFDRMDHLREHLRKVHAEDIPKQGRGIERGLERLENIGSYNANSKAPSELKTSVKNNNEVPTPTMESAKYSSRILKPVGLPDNPRSLECLSALSYQTPYVVEKGPGTGSSAKKSISHDMGEDHKESPSSTSLESVGDLQVASEPGTTQGAFISQSVNPGYEHNELNPNKIGRPSIVFADVEPSTMTITRERGVQDTVEPESIVLEPDNKARASMVDQSVQTMPPTLIDNDNRLLSHLSEDECEHSQDGDDVSFVADHSSSNLNPVAHVATATMVEDGIKTGYSGVKIEPVEDISHHQKPVEHSKAVMDSSEPSIGDDIISMEKSLTSHVHPVKASENITVVKDVAQMNTSRNLVEVVDDLSPHMAHETRVSTKLDHIAPQYDAYVMTLLSLRLELRIWHGRHAPSPTIHISTGGEELLEEGKQRIRWTCRCGRRLYDDFEELRPGALEELEQMLNEQNRVCSPESNRSDQQSSSSTRTLWNAAGRISFIFGDPISSIFGIIASLTGSRPFRNNNPPTLPLHQHHAAGQERDSPSSATLETLFLLMCIPYRKHGTRLVHMDLADLISDETLFKKMKCEYQSIRGQWASYFSLWRMAEIQFVKFGLHKHQLVDIKEKNDLPPVSLKNEYRYQPIPAETIPPIGKNHLMHLYEHPDHADDVPFCLERIPKKVREQLRLCQNQAPGLVGWGVYFAEGFNWPKFWVLGFVVLSLSVLFGVCWSTLRHDVQGGFGVTACMMVTVTFTTGVVQAAVGQT